MRHIWFNPISGAVFIQEHQPGDDYIRDTKCEVREELALITLLDGMLQSAKNSPPEPEFYELKSDEARLMAENWIGHSLPLLSNVNMLAWARDSLLANGDIKIGEKVRITHHMTGEIIVEG